jgi:hypothetical protein
MSLSNTTHTPTDFSFGWHDRHDYRGAVLWSRDRNYHGISAGGLRMQYGTRLRPVG